MSEKAENSVSTDCGTEHSSLNAYCENELLSYGHSVNYPPFYNQETHVHEMCEIYCVFRGNGYYVTEGARHKLESGKVLLMRSGEAHRAVCTDLEPYERVSIHFLPSVVDTIDPKRTLLRTFFDRPLGKNNVYDRSRLASTGVYECFECMRVPCGDNDAHCVQVLTQLFPLLYDLACVFDSGFGDTVDEKSLFLHELVDYVNRNLTGELSLDILCKKFYLTRGQLRRSFKSATGSNVWEYILLKRLLLAREYIRDGMNASEAASAVGFHDYSTFYRAYLKKYGATPTGVLRQIR